MIGARTVIRGKIPPYAIVSGNPSKVVGFRFTPIEVVERELHDFQEENRLSLAMLEKNYEKYFLNRIKEIKEFSRL